jgi:hypothetical protein
MVGLVVALARRKEGVQFGGSWSGALIKDARGWENVNRDRE